MFTGIVEKLAPIVSIEENGSNRSFWLETELAMELKVDQSVSHNGICLTVEEIDGHRYKLTAIDETLQKTTAGSWQVGQLVNIERCLPMNGRLDGHLVQGHVDGKGRCTQVVEKEGSWEYTIAFPEKFAALMIEKGSICLNGISLTAFNVGRNEFTVAIIPYTYEHTNMKQLQAGHEVNLEFDMVGKYIQRFHSLQAHAQN